MKLETLHKISYGLYIVSAAKNGELNGQIVNTVFQVAPEPPVIALSINKKNLTHEYIVANKKFAVSILEKGTPMRLIGTFGFKSGHNIDKFKDVKVKNSKSGTPVVLDYALGFIEAEVVSQIDCATHTVFLAKVIDAKILNSAEPMTYAYYHDVKGGKAPPTAPTYIKEHTISEIKPEEKSKMQKYVCKVCGYVYDPEKGDPGNGIKPGTLFDGLPADWVCPECGVGKDQFEKMA